MLDSLSAEQEHELGKGHVLTDMNGRKKKKNVSFSFVRAKKTLKNINLTI